MSFDFRIQYGVVTPRPLELNTTNVAYFRKHGYLICKLEDLGLSTGMIPELVALVEQQINLDPIGAIRKKGALARTCNGLENPIDPKIMKIADLVKPQVIKQTGLVFGQFLGCNLVLYPEKSSLGRHHHKDILVIVLHLEEAEEGGHFSCDDNTGDTICHSNLCAGDVFIAYGRLNHEVDEIIKGRKVSIALNFREDNN